LILDTNALSALLEGDPSIGPIIQGISPLHLPVIVIGEYRFGLLRSRFRAVLAPRHEALIERSRVLAVDLRTTIQYAEIRDELRRRGSPVPENDLWIAALARQHELPVVSRDEHFDRVPRLERRSW
jgi:predicted nucleic acid-binding protein